MRVNEKRRKKYKEIVSHARNYVYAKIKIKVERTGEKRERKYIIRYQFILKKSSLEIKEVLGSTALKEAVDSVGSGQADRGRIAAWVLQPGVLRHRAERTLRLDFSLS